jgi:hypothetical protein
LPPPVGMSLGDQPPVGRLDLGGRGISGQAQDLVCLLQRHGDIIARASIA